jgi:hypothetical protein
VDLSVIEPIGAVRGSPVAPPGAPSAAEGGQPKKYPPEGGCNSSDQLLALFFCYEPTLFDRSGRRRPARLIVQI